MLHRLLWHTGASRLRLLPVRAVQTSTAKSPLYLASTDVCVSRLCKRSTPASFEEQMPRGSMAIFLAFRGLLKVRHVQHGLGRHDGATLPQYRPASFTSNLAGCHPTVQALTRLSRHVFDDGRISLETLKLGVKKIGRIAVGRTDVRPFTEHGHLSQTSPAESGIRWGHCGNNECNRSRLILLSL